MTEEVGGIQIESDSMFHSQIFDADRLMRFWSKKSERTSQLAFYIGRAFHYSGQTRDALRWYKTAGKIEPVFSWINFELSELYHADGDATRSAQMALAFVETIANTREIDHLSKQHASLLLQKAHRIFELDRPLALRLYRVAYANAIFDYFSLLRIIESSNKREQLDDAKSLMGVLRANFKLDAFGHLALSRIAEGEGLRDEAVSAVMAANDLLPSHVWLRGQVCSRLLDLRAFDIADAAIERFATDPRLDIEDVSQRLPSLLFRSAVLQHRAAAALEVIDDVDHLWSSIEEWVYCEAIYTFARFGTTFSTVERRVIDRLTGYLAPRAETSESACLAMLHYHAVNSAWAEADQLLRAVSGLAMFESRNMVVKRFEVACHTQRLDEAALIYERYWKGDDALNLTELVLSMRFMSELKDWAGAADMAASIVERGLSLPDDIFGFVTIIRRAGQHQRFAALLKATRRSDSFSQQLRQLLVDDLCIANGTAQLTFDGDEAPTPVSRSNAILVKPVETANPEANRHAAFICSDRAYFVSVLSLLASIAPNVGRTADWFLFVSEDVPQAWLRALAEFCTKLSFDIAIIPEDAFFVRSEGCPTDYGLFSAGRHLARSAYFRIYAAKWLLRRNRYARAFYLDSDIVCQADLGAVFEVDMAGAPLMARPEEPSAAVAKAAAICGVDPDDYINSGVLLFDLDHPRIAQHIDDAIWQSENAGARLTFHDQCALNIAFAGGIGHLPDRFNTYLRPFKTYDDLSAGVLVHYLDRPKPWDSGFTSGHRLPWLMAATVVKALMPAETYHDIVAAGLGQVAVPPSAQLVHG